MSTSTWCGRHVGIRASWPPKRPRQSSAFGRRSLSAPFLYPSDREDIARAFRWPLGRLWLRVLARLMEWLTDVQPKQLNYSEVTPQLAVGGAFRTRQIKRLKQRGVTAVVDCRLEAQDNPQALTAAGIEFLHLPTLDRHGFTYAQLHEGVDWVLEHVSEG